MPSNVENKSLLNICDAQETNYRSAKFSRKPFLSLLGLLKFSASGSRTHKGLTAEPAWQISGFFMSRRLVRILAITSVSAIQQL